MGADPSRFLQALEATTQDDVVEVSIVFKDGRVFRWEPDGPPDGRMRITKPLRRVSSMPGRHMDSGDIVYRDPARGATYFASLSEMVPEGIQGKPDEVKCGEVVKVGEPGPLGQWRIVVEFIPDGQEDL